MLQEELVKDLFRAKGFGAEIDLRLRSAVRLTNVPFRIQFGSDTPRAKLGLENEPMEARRPGILSMFSARAPVAATARTRPSNFFSQYAGFYTPLPGYFTSGRNQDARRMTS